ncbi:BAB2_0123 family type IV secretion system effector [Brucella sp. LJL56]
MSLLLANVLSTMMALASLAALIVVGRKANETIKLGKVLALRVAAASNGLERAVKAIQSERTDLGTALADENNKLEARLAETQRVRREMDEAIEELNRLRKALTRDIRHARNVADSTPRAQEKTATATEQSLPKEKNALPVFVRRAVRKATVELAGQA